MDGMRRFSKDSRLQADSVSDIVDPWSDEARRIARTHGLEFNKRKLSGGPLLNALALWFMEQPAEIRDQIAARAVAKLEAFLSETDEERAASHAKLEGLQDAADSRLAVAASGVVVVHEEKRRGVSGHPPGRDEGDP